MTDARAVVLASGGMDSATAAAVARHCGYDLCMLHVAYGQRTESKEYACVSSQAEHFDAVDVCHLATDHLSEIGGSSLTDDDLDVPDHADSDSVPTSYVPFRNANLLAMAVSYSEARDCEAVFVGAHTGDAPGYPDCRPRFFDAFQRVIDTGTPDETTIDVRAPFAEWSKTDVARRGLELDVPYELTWSCYRNESPACGTCDACALRLEAFQRLDTRDPIQYDERPTYIATADD